MPPRPAADLSRSAALIHGLGLLAAALCAGLIALGWSEGDAIAFVGLAGLTAVVCVTWSGVLAGRALLRTTLGTPETPAMKRLARKLPAKASPASAPANPPRQEPLAPAVVAPAMPGAKSKLRTGQVAAAVFSLVLFQLFAGGMWLWSVAAAPSEIAVLIAAVRLGLPVLAPFAALATGIALPLALKSAKRAEARAIAAGIKSRDRNSARAGAVVFAGIILVLAVLLLPIPLYVLGGAAAQLRTEEGEPDSWIATYTDSMPRALGTFGDVFIRFMPDGPGISLRRNLMRTGSLPPEWLYTYAAELQHAPFNDDAWAGLKKVDRAIALQLAHKVGQADLSPTLDVEMLARYLARYGTPEQIDYYLDLHTSKLSEFTLEILREGQNVEFLAPTSARRLDLLEAMTEHFAAKGEFFDEAGTWWAKVVPLERGLARMREYGAKLETASIASQIVWVFVQRDCGEPLAIFGRHPEDYVRLQACKGIYEHRDELHPHLFRNPANVEHIQMVRLLYALTTESNVYVRLYCAGVLDVLYCNGEHLNYAPSLEAGKLPPNWNGFDNDVNATRKAVAAWFAKRRLDLRLPDVSSQVSGKENAEGGK